MFSFSKPNFAERCFLLIAGIGAIVLIAAASYYFVRFPSFHAQATARSMALDTVRTKHVSEHEPWPQSANPTRDPSGSTPPQIRP